MKFTAFPRIAIAVVFVACTFSAANAGEHPDESAPRVFQSSGIVLADLRHRATAGDPALSRAVAALRKDADAAMADGPFTIVNKKHPLPGIDAHDYVSLARYFWPDPSKPDGLPYISRDGVTNPEIDEYDAKPLLEMSNHV